MTRWVLLGVIVAVVAAGAAWVCVAAHVPWVIGLGVVLITAGALWPSKRSPPAKPRSRSASLR
jgi:hypothetical protein